MRLYDDQVSQYEEDGYLMVADCFNIDEVALLRREAETLFEQNRPEIRTEHNGAPRTAFAPHLYNDLYSILVRHPRIVKPTIQLIGENVYLNQVKLNSLPAYEGVGFNWHQDFGTAWKLADGMPTDQALSVAVFIDDVSDVNSPMMVIPGSHKHGDIDAAENTATVRPRFVPDRAVVSELAEKRGIDLCTGKAGSVLIFHSNLVHGSANNLSPWNRKIIFICFAAISNTTKLTDRREPWISLRNFKPVVPLPDDCLSRFI